MNGDIPLPTAQGAHKEGKSEIYLFLEDRQAMHRGPCRVQGIEGALKMVKIASTQHIWATGSPSPQITQLPLYCDHFFSKNPKILGAHLCLEPPGTVMRYYICSEKSIPIHKPLLLNHPVWFFSWDSAMKPVLCLMDNWKRNMWLMPAYCPVEISKQNSSIVLLRWCKGKAFFKHSTERQGNACQNNLSSITSRFACTSPPPPPCTSKLTWKYLRMQPACGNKCMCLNLFYHQHKSLPISGKLLASKQWDWWSLHHIWTCQLRPSSSVWFALTSSAFTDKGPSHPQCEVLEICGGRREVPRTWQWNWCCHIAHEYAVQGMYCSFIFPVTNRLWVLKFIIIKGTEVF